MKYYVQMIVKYAEQNERVKDIDTPMEVVKKFDLKGLRQDGQETCHL